VLVSCSRATIVLERPGLCHHLYLFTESMLQGNVLKKVLGPWPTSVGAVFKHEFAIHLAIFICIHTTIVKFCKLSSRAQVLNDKRASLGGGGSWGRQWSAKGTHPASELLRLWLAATSLTVLFLGECTPYVSRAISHCVVARGQVGRFPPAA